MNIKLASMLTEYTIDVFREVDENEADEDIYDNLSEFELDAADLINWAVDELQPKANEAYAGGKQKPGNLILLRICSCGNARWHETRLWLP